ncbi:hypothetical protein [Actinoplanes subtropicus]|uniref:hypothetical protein n=1 Tax=Actinoplanes subtropicus TaxID=543632 RepID=UPI0004C35858|nr:hypothetical protein [Actinoplanes subtropicus]
MSRTRIDPDVLSAALQAAVVLLLTLARSDPPRTASIAFIGVGCCAYLMLSAATLRYPERAAELRGILTVTGTLAAAGFVLRLGPDPAGALREWTLFTVGAGVLFLSTGWPAGFRWTTGGQWVAAGLTLAAAVALVPARGLDGTRAGALLAYSAPVPVLALALTALAAGAARLSPARFSLTAQAWVVSLPPLAVYAYTRDPGALPLVGLPLFAVLVAAHLTGLGGGWLRLLAVSTSSVLCVVAGVAGLIAFHPGGAFRLTGPASARDLLGAAPGTTGSVAGGPAVVLLLALSAVLSVQVALLFAAVVRRPERDRDEVLPFVAGVTVLLLVLLAGPGAAGAGLPVPASLAVLPIASDGASYLITLAGVGLLFGVAADRRRETPSGQGRR